MNETTTPPGRKELTSFASLASGLFFLSKTGISPPGMAHVSPITLSTTATQGFYRLRRLTNDEMHEQFVHWLASQP